MLLDVVRRPDIQQLVLPDYATVLSTGHRQTSFHLLTDPASSPPSLPPPRTPSALPGECPKGVAWADDATAVDSAHKGAVHGVTGVMCSNKGICDLSNGVCTCQVGYEGMACHRSKLPDLVHQLTATGVPV